MSDVLHWVERSIAPWEDEPVDVIGSFAYWRALARTDPMLESAHIVIRYWLGGQRVLLMSTTPLTTEGRVGQMWWNPMLLESPSLSLNFSLDSHSAAERSIEIVADRTGYAVAFAGLMMEGRVFAGLAEVALVVDGMDFSKRLVLMRGRASSTSFGEPGTPIRTTISDLRMFSNELIPSTVVSKETWPGAPEASIGRRVPLVMNGTTRSPCVCVRQVLTGEGVPSILTYVACAYTEGLEVTAVYVNGSQITPEATGTYSPCIITVEEDSEGSRVIMLNFSDSEGPWNGGETVSVDMEVSNPARMLTLPALVRALLSQNTKAGTRGIDDASFSSAEHGRRLPVPRLAVTESGSATASVFDLIETGLLESFPMGYLIFEGQGIGMVIVDRRAGPRAGHAEVTLTVPQITNDIIFDAGIASMSPPVLERVGPYIEQCDLNTEYEVRWGLSVDGKTWAGLLRAHPGNHVGCRTALDLMNNVGNAMPPLDAPFCASESDAALVLEWLVAHNSVPSYRATLRCVPSAILVLRRGMTVRYSDHAIFPAGVGAVATILNIEWSLSDCLVDVQVWHPYWASKT